MSDAITPITTPQGNPLPAPAYATTASQAPGSSASTPASASTAPAAQASSGSAQTDPTSSPATKLELSSASGVTVRQPSASAPMSMEEAANAYQNYLSSLPSNLKLEPDSAAGMVIIKVVNPVTQKVIRQLPPEDVIEQAKYLRSAEKANHSGILLDQSL